MVHGRVFPANVVDIRTVANSVDHIEPRPDELAKCVKGKHAHTTQVYGESKSMASKADMLRSTDFSIKSTECAYEIVLAKGGCK